MTTKMCLDELLADYELKSEKNPMISGCEQAILHELEYTYTTLSPPMTPATGSAWSPYFATDPTVFEEFIPSYSPQMAYTPGFMTPSTMSPHSHYSPYSRPSVSQTPIDFDDDEIQILSMKPGRKSSKATTSKTEKRELKNDAATREKGRDAVRKHRAKVATQIQEQEASIAELQEQGRKFDLELNSVKYMMQQLSDYMQFTLYDRLNVEEKNEMMKILYNI